MFDVLIQEFTKLISITMGKPSSMIELLALSVFAGIAFMIIINKLGGTFHVPKHEMVQAFIIFFAGAIALGFVVASINIYVAPKVDSCALRSWLPVLSATAALLAVATPFACLVQKSKYPTTLLMIVLSIAGAAVIVAMVAGLFESVRTGQSQLEKKKAFDQRAKNIR